MPDAPTDIAEKRQNMSDEQTMPDFGGDAGEQDSYLAPDTPEWAIVPPTGEQFANATWLRAGPEIRALVDEVLNFEEFTDVAALHYEITWRRRSKPTRTNRFDEADPIFAGVTLVPDRVIWEALQQDCTTFPRFWVDLHWQHFEALREDGQWVHGETVQRDVHAGLSRIDVENDILRTVPPDFTGNASTVKRYGLYSAGVRAVAQQISLWETKQPG